MKLKIKKYERQLVNKQRRTRDKEALKKELTYNNEDVCYDPWNRKTNKHFIYV